MVWIRRYQRWWLFAFCTLTLSASGVAQFETRGSFIADSRSQPLSIAVGDFNHDGKPDLAVVSYCCPTGGVSILLGRGDGTFNPGVYYAAGEQPYSVVAADFNNDGNLDLAVANCLSNYITILMGNGDGTFRPGPQSPAVPAPACFVTTGDFNGDGKPDLVAIGNSLISVLLSNGDGTFQSAVTTQPPFAVTSIAVGDFNGDHKLDLATAGSFGSSSSLNILLGNGDGTFQYGASYAYAQAPGLITAADFNRDHKLDLAVSDAFQGMTVWLGNGDGTFQAPTAYRDVSAGSSIIAADMNGDHILDLVVGDWEFPSGVSVLLGNGDGTFQAPTYYPGAASTAGVAVGDFNRDRKTDMVLTGKDNVIVLLNTGVASFSPTNPLRFGNQAVGTTSAPLTVRLTNTGTSALSISSMKATGQFGVTSTCGSSVAAGANCTISATFSPTKKGYTSGTVTIIDSASSKPQVIALFGTGT